MRHKGLVLWYYIVLFYFYSFLFLTKIVNKRVVRKTIFRSTGNITSAKIKHTVFSLSWWDIFTNAKSFFLICIVSCVGVEIIGLLLILLKSQVNQWDFDFGRIEEVVVFDQWKWLFPRLPVFEPPCVSDPIKRYFLLIVTACCYSAKINFIKHWININDR